MHGQLVGGGGDDHVELLEDAGGLAERVGDDAREHPVGGMGPDPHRGDRAEVAAASADGPEQLGLMVIVHADRPPVGEHEVGAEQVVGGQAEPAAEEPVPAAEGQGRHPDGCRPSR